MLEENQIMIEVSKDRTRLTISCGLIEFEHEYDIEPNFVKESVIESLKDFFKETMLDGFMPWCSTDSF